jgi:hypothetical protein
VNKKNNRFNIALYEAAFTATCETAFAENRVLDGKIEANGLLLLANDDAFIEAASKASTGSGNVEARLNRARTYLKSL